MEDVEFKHPLQAENMEKRAVLKKGNRIDRNVNDVYRKGPKARPHGKNNHLNPKLNGGKAVVKHKAAINQSNVHIKSVKREKAVIVPEKSKNTNTTINVDANNAAKMKRVLGKKDKVRNGTVVLSRGDAGLHENHKPASINRTEKHSFNKTKTHVTPKPIQQNLRGLSDEAVMLLNSTEARRKRSGGLHKIIALDVTDHPRDPQAMGQFGQPAKVPKDKELESRKRWDEGHFNVFLSDQIPVDRAIPDTRPHS